MSPPDTVVSATSRAPPPPLLLLLLLLLLPLFPLPLLPLSLPPVAAYPYACSTGMRWWYDKPVGAKYEASVGRCCTGAEDVDVYQRPPVPAR
jgi:hypothetical protein